MAPLRITPIGVILFTKVSVALTCIWPPSPEATKFRVALFKAWWHTCCISTVLLLLPLLNSVYEYRDDPMILAKSICLSCAVLQVTVKMVMCHSQYTRFQKLYHEMEMFCKQANDKTNVTLQRYVDNHKNAYGIYALWCYLAAIGVICGPLFLPQQFPTHAKYPFAVEQSPMKNIVYLHQSLVGLQAAAGMCIDITIALLLYYSAARLDLLGRKLRNVTNERELDVCIKLHDEILRYTAEVTSVIRPLVLTTITTTAIGVVFGSLNMVAEQPKMVKVQYTVVLLSASIELFMCALPADKLIHTSSEICLAAYDSQWFHGSVSMQKKIFHIIFRSQKPETIHIKGILPVLSLRYYAGFLYTSCSYFTAVRMMMNENIRINQRGEYLS